MSNTLDIQESKRLVTLCSTSTLDMKKSKKICLSSLDTSSGKTDLNNIEKKENKNSYDEYGYKNIEENENLIINNLGVINFKEPYKEKINYLALLSKLKKNMKLHTKYIYPKCSDYQNYKAIQIIDYIIWKNPNDYLDIIEKCKDNEYFNEIYKLEFNNFIEYKLQSFELYSLTSNQLRKQKKLYKSIPIYTKLSNCLNNKNTEKVLSIVNENVKLVKIPIHTNTKTIPFEKLTFDGVKTPKDKKNEIQVQNEPGFVKKYVSFFLFFFLFRIL
jgi:hypothetical protein